MSEFFTPASGLVDTMRGGQAILSGNSSVKVGFVLLSNSRNPIPSTRIAVLNMFPYLRDMGFDPHIVYEPTEVDDKPEVDGLGARLVSDGFQIVVFQKVGGDSIEALARELGAAGIRTVFCVCDFINVRMASVTNATIVVTDFLKSLYPQSLQSKIHVIHDGIERPELFKQQVSSRRGTFTKRLRAVLVTSMSLKHLPQIGTPPRWLHVTIVGRYPPSHNVKQRLGQVSRQLRRSSDTRQRLDFLRFFLDTNISCVAWDPVNVYRHMLEADVGIIPINDLESPADQAEVPSWKVKSENRLSMKMSLGLPVVTSRIPAYEPLIQQGHNGFFARDRSEWLEHLNTLRDPVMRARVGQAARETVVQRYSMKEQARLMSELFRKLLYADAIVLP